MIGRSALRQLLAICLLLSTAATAGCRTEPAAPVAPPAALPIAAPAQQRVGEPVVLTIGPAELPDDAPVQVLLLSSAGVRLVDGRFRNGLAVVTLSGAATEAAGLVTVTAFAEGYRGSADILLHADSPVEPVTPLIGARTITANGSDWSMTVVVPFDRFGNPQPDDTPVLVRALHPGDRLEIQRAVVRELLAWVRLTSGTRAGRTTVAVEVDGMPGPEGTLIEVPGPPVPFDLEARPPALPADGRLLVTVRTSVLTDQFGNVLPDGTVVTLRCADPDQTVRYLSSLTIDGTAEFVLQAARSPGDAMLTAVAFGVPSRPLVIPFTPNARSFPVSLALNTATGQLVVTAGPFLGALGQYLPDGTAVQFRLRSETGRSLPWQTLDGTRPAHFDAVVESGYAEAPLRLDHLAAGRYTVEATAEGVSATAEFALPEAPAP